MSKSDTYKELYKILSFDGDRKEMQITSMLDLLYDWFSGDDMKGFLEHVRKEYDANKTEED